MLCAERRKSSRRRESIAGAAGATAARGADQVEEIALLAGGLVDPAAAPVAREMNVERASPFPRDRARLPVVPGPLPARKVRAADLFGPSGESRRQFPRSRVQRHVSSRPGSRGAAPGGSPFPALFPIPGPAAARAQLQRGAADGAGHVLSPDATVRGQPVRRAAAVRIRRPLAGAAFFGTLREPFPRGAATRRHRRVPVTRRPQATAFPTTVSRRSPARSHGRLQTPRSPG